VIHQRELRFRTPGRGTIDITREVAEVVAASGIVTGLCNVFVRHTSASLILCENADPTVHGDLEMAMARLAPDGSPGWRHDTEGPDDMAAHLRTVLTGPSLTVPVGAAHLLLGVWQGVYLWEHRTRPHPRQVVVTVHGER
jgi:secondary thiamine-phosphate synthase enzyme